MAENENTTTGAGIKYVKAEKPVTTTHEKLGELKIEIEVPQLESLDYLPKWAGDDAAALGFVNSAIETAVKNVCRAAMRNVPADANLDDVVSKIQSLAHDYTPNAGARDMSKAKKVEAFDKIRAQVAEGREFSREELLALLDAAK